jgi:RNA polymerase sigma-70 factor (ECF subfamily)
MNDSGERRRDVTLGASGRDEKFERFVHRHFYALEKSLTVIALDSGVAAEAAQEAFLRLYLRWDQVDSLDDPVAWLYRVGINRCHDYRRQLKRAARLFDRLMAVADAGQPSDEWAPSIEFISLVRRLPKQQRIAAVLFYQADLPAKEVARVMHISESTVKSHLQRARETLRPLLEAD